jgi:hypothetical protein
MFLPNTRDICQKNKVQLLYGQGYKNMSLQSRSADITSKTVHTGHGPNLIAIGEIR